MTDEPTMQDANSETSQEAPPPAEIAEQVDAVEEAEHGFEPRGAFFFVIALIIAYGLYFFIVYGEVILQRGGS